MKNLLFLLSLPLLLSVGISLPSNAGTEDCTFDGTTYGDGTIIEFEDGSAIKCTDGTWIPQ